MDIRRCSRNPIITPAEVIPSREDFEVAGVFNPAAVKIGKKTILLLRVAERPVTKDANIKSTAVYDCYQKRIICKKFTADDEGYDFSDERMWTTPQGRVLSTLSHLRIAESTDGVNFKIHTSPAIFPETWYESYGIEDARITPLDDKYYITYVGVSPYGVVTGLIRTKDFSKFERLGIIFCPENKDVVLFPEKINGRYYALHRPITPLFDKQHIWLAQSSDLLNWGNHKFVYSGKAGRWDGLRTGAGTPPIKTDKGWLEIYHGVDKNNRYCGAALMLDADKPWKVIAKTPSPLFEPKETYEKEGFYGNVVFPTAAVKQEDELVIYYGVSDSAVCSLNVGIDEIISKLT
jgi:predicted GH43/DUF377 family glycosyl hydrolase